MTDEPGSYNVRLHRVFLIRHGETVDNVAGLYAGVRDSELTVHGVQQADRLGRYFHDEKIVLTHVFSSNLSRAYKTACALTKHQDTGEAIEVVQCPDLREQDFGAYEGKSFKDRARNLLHQGRQSHGSSSKIENWAGEVESKSSMRIRADRFVDTHLSAVLKLPIVATVAIVSHGMLLSSLWKCILERQPQSSVSISPEVMANSPPVALERLGGWSNTGYLELEIRIGQQAAAEASQVFRSLTSSDETELRTQNPTDDAESARIRTTDNNHDMKILVRNVNHKKHLDGLKRARGGVGSSAYDEKQKSIGEFFKKRRTD